MYLIWFSLPWFLSILVKIYIYKKQEKSQINNLTLPLEGTKKKKKKKKKTKPKANKRKEITKIRTEINEIETKKTIDKINETRSCFAEKIKSANL